MSCRATRRRTVSQTTVRLFYEMQKNSWDVGKDGGLNARCLQSKLPRSQKPHSIGR